MFHGFTLGGMRAVIISDGPLVLPAPRKLFRKVDRGLIDQTLKAAGLPTDEVRLQQNCLLVESAGTRVLFDNGMGSSRLFGDESGQLLSGLAEAGIAPASIGALVLTHAHADHCWGTIGDDGQPNFPNAAIYISREELDYWTADPPLEADEASVEGFRRNILPLRDRIHIVRDGAEFLPGITAWATPGHTPGHMAYLFAGGWCLTGDVAFLDPLSFRFPDAHCVYDTDRAQAATTRRRALERLADEKLRIIGYHQPWPGLGWVERGGAAFRFVAG